MNRWNEIRYTLGFNILFPRFCLFVLVPCGVLLVIPSPPDFPLLLAVLQLLYAKVVVAGSLLLFGLSVAANLSVSQYLRLHQRADSSYIYEPRYAAGKYTPFFRVQVSNKEDFRHLLREISRNHPTEPIRFWLLADRLVLVPPVLLLAAFSAVFILAPLLIKLFWGWLTKQKPRPAAQG